MKGFLAKLCKKNGIAKRILSVALSVLMLTSVIQVLPVGILKAYAAENYTVTVHCYDAEGWGSMSAWIWDTDNKNYTGGTWPGQDISSNAVSGKDNWYDITISEFASSTFSVILSGGGEQTKDLTTELSEISGDTKELWVIGGDKESTSQGAIYTTAPSQWTGVSAGGEPPYTVTVHCYDAEGWGSMSAWIWDTDNKNYTGGTWPGQDISSNAVSGKDNWYDITISDFASSTFSVILSGGGEQTKDLTTELSEISGDTKELWVFGGDKESTSQGAIYTTAPSQWTNSSSGGNTSTSFNGTVTLHFKNEANWGGVYTYLWDSSNTPLNDAYPGKASGENTNNTGWFDTTVDLSLSDSKLNLIFSDGNNDDSKKTKDIAYTLAAGTTDLWITGGQNATTDTISTTAPEGWVAGGSVKKTLKLHYYNTNDWSAVSAYLHNGSTIGATWPGTTATKENSDTSNKWYVAEMSDITVDNLKVIMSNNGSNQEADVDITLTDASTELWLKNGEITDYDPDKLRSPIVNGKEVTFNYESASESAAYIRGTFCGWGDTDQIAMTKTGDVFSKTITLSPGTYGYKFYTTDWLTDPLNTTYTSEGNNLLIVPGLYDYKAEVKKGVDVTLPETLSYIDAKGVETSKTVTYSIKDSANASYVTISGNTVNVSSDYTDSTISFIATATDDTSLTSEVTLTLVANTYVYTVYAHSAIADRNNISNTVVYIWDKAEETLLEAGDHAFTTTEVLEDGRTWLKMEIELACSKEIGFILKSKGDWSWQTSDLIFTNSAKTDQTIYIVDGYSRAYTDLDDVPQDSWLYVEYTRSDASYANTYAYAWNNGYSYKEDGVSKNLNYPVQNINGKYVAKIPVVVGSTEKSVGFIMQKGTDLTNKDGGDNYVTVPNDEKITKVRFANGQITNVVPASKGYSIDRDNMTLNFYYRDEDLFAECNLDSLTDVKLVLRTAVGTGAVSAEKTYQMTYSETNDRFESESITLTEDSDFYYYYLVGGTRVLDSHNKRTATLDGITYSLCRNRVYNVTLNASVKYTSMDYDDSNVLYLNWTGTDLEGFTPEKVYVDLSALGLDSKTEMDTELMALSFGCLEGTTIGGKAIKVTLIDDCDMTYTTNVTVNVKARTKTANTATKLGTFDWDEAVIYFAITDRFFDGNTENNLGDPDSTADDETYDPNDPGSYHGGDFAGLTQKIDYLYDLGVNTIWLTPIVDDIDINLDEEDNYENSDSYGYHGYWASDFTTLNPHLGTEAEFAALVSAAHAKGMKIMVDVVLNHSGYETEDYFNSILDGKNMVRDSSNTVPGDQRQDGLSGLPDFVTEDEDVRAQLIEWQTGWMTDYDIDYYRVDTVKHVDNTTWSAFKNALIEENQDFKLIGEYYDAGYLNDYDQLDSGRMDSLLDFNFNDLMLKLVDEDLTGIEEALSDRNSSLSNTATLGSFTSSHDEPGLLYTMENTYSEGDWAESLMRVAATYQITAKGQPVIYYGEELGLSGANNYPYQDNRYDFDWEEQEAQASDEDSMYNHYKTLLNIRRDYSEVFAKGTRNQVVSPLITDADGNAINQGYEVFSKSYEGKTVYVGVNVWGDAKTTKVYVSGAVGSVYTDLYNNKSYTVASDGSITISIPGAQDGGTAILVGTDKTVTDNNKITLKLHYTRTAGDYTDWNAWIWSDSLSGNGYELEDVNGEKVVTVTVDGRATDKLYYIMRKGDWKEKDHDGKDQYIDLSDVVSGTVHYYVDQGVFGGTRSLGTNAVTGNKIVSTEYDRNTNTVTVNMSRTLSGNLSKAFTIKCSSNNTVIGISDIEENGNVYTLTLSKDISSLEAMLLSYTITYDGYTYTLMTPNVYSSEEFENAYTYDGDDLGLTYTSTKSTFKLWAPTADSVKLNIYTSGTKGTKDLEGSYTMTKGDKGVWSYSLSGDWNGKYYTYTVNVNNAVNEICDPYARTTGVNGNRAMILDLDSTDPEGWENDTGAHTDMDYTDAVIYELHVRDLSSDDSSGVSEANQGKFLGLTETGTTTEGGMATALDHIIELGVTHLHLLPIYDYASVDETKLNTDQFNWGYDPLNYNVPEGSYSTDPYDGAVRVNEMKQMVQTLHNNNINVIMDVVYNHVYDAGTFCFNQAVPKYFSRTNADGSYSNGSGCGNDTASERSMVHKYIVDSILYWHEEYHIDGFRFDLVGLLDTETINEIVDSVHAVDPDIIFYGEGWTMDTAVSKENVTMATQANASATPNFAYFNDTFRDGIAGKDAQGNGLIWQVGNESTMSACYLGRSWWCTNPTQTINYASCHDNYTLMDKINAVSNAGVDSYEDVPGDYQVKLNNLTAAYYMFAEGIPLIHAGEDFLRIKLDEDGTIIHNSYNASDYVNTLRWYNLDTEVYADTTEYYKGLIEFRKNHAALRLSTATEVSNNVTYHWVTNNVLLYTFDGASVADEVADGIITIYNASSNDCQINLYGKDGNGTSYGVAQGEWQVCVNGDNAGTEVLSTITNGVVTVPAHTAMALVKGETVDTDSVYTRNNKVAISLDKTEIETGVNAVVAINATVNPANSTLIWESSDETVATVDAYGRVTTLADGNATITVSTLHGVTATCEVTVDSSIEVEEEVSINKTELSLVKGSSETLVVTISPVGTTATFVSSDESVVTIDETGKVTAVGVGTATITITTAGNKTVTCTVTVTKPVTKPSTSTGSNNGSILPGATGTSTSTTTTTTTTTDTTGGATQSTSKGTITVPKDMEVIVETDAETNVPEDVDTVTPIVDADLKEAVKLETEKLLEDVANDEVAEGVLDETTIQNIKDAKKDGVGIITEVIVETVDESTVDSDVKIALEQALTDSVKGKEGVTTKIAQYLDLSVLLKTTDGKELGKINKMSEPLTFTIAIPEDLKQDGRVFVVLRMHDGETSVLETTMNADGTLSFETDRFSTYALAYIDGVSAEDVETTVTESAQDENATSQDGTTNYTWFIIFGILIVIAAGLFILFLFLKKKKKEDEEQK